MAIREMKTHEISTLSVSAKWSTVKYSKTYTVYSVQYIANYSHVHVKYKLDRSKRVLTDIDTLGKSRAWGWHFSQQQLTYLRNMETSTKAAKFESQSCLPLCQSRDCGIYSDSSQSACLPWTIVSIRNMI